MITKKRYAIRNGVRPMKKKHSLFGGGGLFADQEIAQQQGAATDESIPDPVIEAAVAPPPPPQASGAELTGQGGYDEAIMESGSDQAANKIVDAIPIAKLFRGLGEAGSNAIIGDSTGEERKKKQKWAAAIFAPHKLLAIRKADKAAEEEKKKEAEDNTVGTYGIGGRVRVIKKFAPGGVIEDDTKKGLFRKDKRDMDTPGQDRLALAAANQMKHAYDPETEDLSRTENDPQLGGFIQNELFPQVSTRELDATKTPWSAATVTDLAKAYNPEFKGGIGHWQYINQAFEDNRGLKKGGTHRPVNLQGVFDRGDTLAAGTILFQGRDDPKNPERSTKGFSFGDFRKRSKKDSGTPGNQYASHTDMIVDTITGEDGEIRYLVQGGNRGNLGVLKSDYLTAEEIQGRYPGALVPNREHSGARSQPGDRGISEVTAYR